MLKRLLFKNQDFKQLVIAMIGSLLGVTFLITSIHYLLRVNEYGKGAEILGPNTIIVQRKVNAAASFGLAKTGFDMKEIQKMREESFIEDVQPVFSNNFDVSFETSRESYDDVPPFRSDVFIQTINPDFMDVKAENWDWKPGDEFVPIVMPRDIIVMMNTFMSAQGIPQISDEVAKSIKFRFTLSNDEGKEWVDARIVGFTNEVSSVLVPQSFMDYGKEKYAKGVPENITQIIIAGKEKEFGKVEEFLNKKGLESKNAQVILGRLKSVISTLILVIMSISIIAVFVSGLVLIQYLQLLMSKNSYEVRTLLRLGYAPKQIITTFFMYFIKVFGIVALLGVSLFAVFKLMLDNVLKDGGIYIETSISLMAIIALLVAYALFAIASYFTAKKGVFKEY